MQWAFRVYFCKFYNHPGNRILNWVNVDSSTVHNCKLEIIAGQNWYKFCQAELDDLVLVCMIIILSHMDFPLVPQGWKWDVIHQHFLDKVLWME